jgi:hypothetical protein
MLEGRKLPLRGRLCLSNPRTTLCLWQLHRTTWDNPQYCFCQCFVARLACNDCWTSTHTHTLHSTSCYTTVIEHLNAGVQTRDNRPQTPRLAFAAANGLQQLLMCLLQWLVLQQRSWGYVAAWQHWLCVVPVLQHDRSKQAAGTR